MHNQFKRSLEDENYFKFEEKLIVNKNLDDSAIKCFIQDSNNAEVESSNQIYAPNNQDIPTNEEEQNAKRERLLLLKKKVISKTQDNEEEKDLILIKSSNNSQLMEPIINTINIQLNINSSQEKGKNISSEISLSDYDTYNSEDNDNKLTKKRNIKLLQNIDKEEEGQCIIKKIKLS